MNEDTPVIRLRLSNADRLELPDYVGSDNVEFAPPDGSGETFGEPFTALAIFAASAVALRGLVAFFANRSLERRETTTEIVTEIVHANGTVERKQIKVTDKGEGMTPELAKALGSLSGIPWAELMP